MTYELHPACAAWPAMTDVEIDALAADIKQRSLLFPITLLDGMILDGRNRALACGKAGIEPRTEVYTGDDPIGYVISANLHRRHLPKHRLAFIGETLATLKRGGDHGNQHTGGKVLARTLPNNGDAKTRKQIGKQLGINAQRISDARTVLQRGAPNVIELAKTGKVGMQAAAVYARTTPREQQAKADAAEIKRLGNTRQWVKRKEAPVLVKTGKPLAHPPVKKIVTKGLPSPVADAAEGPPLSASVEERQAFAKKYGVARWDSMDVLFLRVDCADLTRDFAYKVMSLDTLDFPGAEEFAKRLAMLKAYQRRPQDVHKDDFKAEARKVENLLAKHIGSAIDKLTALRAALGWAAKGAS